MFIWNRILVNCINILNSHKFLGEDLSDSPIDLTNRAFDLTDVLFSPRFLFWKTSKSKIGGLAALFINFTFCAEKSIFEHADYFDRHWQNR